MEQQVGILRAQLARKTGCNLETIRYYEKVGLLPGPPRSSNGYRVYSPELVQRLQFILRARDLGYAMDEIRSLLSLTDTGAQTCAEVMARALLQRLAAVRGRLSLCADQAAAAKWWLSMPMASVSAEGPMPKALSTRRTSPLMPGCRHQGRACPLRRARMTSNPLIVA